MNHDKDCQHCRAERQQMALWESMRAINELMDQIAAALKPIDPDAYDRKFLKRCKIRHDGQD